MCKTSTGFIILLIVVCNLAGWLMGLDGLGTAVTACETLLVWL